MRNPARYKYLLSNINFELVLGVPTDLYKICRSMTRGLVLSYLIKTCGEETWQITKDEIQKAVCVSYNGVSNAIKWLREAGFIETELTRDIYPQLAPHLVYKVNYTNINIALEKAGR